MRFGVVGALVIMLVLVRAFASSVFYDPFIHYFEHEFLSADFPEVELGKLVVSIFFRFWLNSLLSIYIIYLIFQNVKQIKFSFKIYLVSFLIPLFVYVLQVENELSNGYLFPFSIRRLLIHPVILLILIPAFYYQKTKEKEL